MTFKSCTATEVYGTYCRYGTLGFYKLKISGLCLEADPALPLWKSVTLQTVTLRRQRVTFFKKKILVFKDSSYV